MPRIDPFQLLKCLSVLLSPEGGINSREEVPRLVNLMTKFSKKLVSKCVYLLILKSTEVTLVDMFMTSGGWLLIHTWLQEAMANSNWNLVQEVLELLLITPVDSTRLRLNNIPKLVKTLSKREDLGDVKEMATSLVNNWLAIVKNSTPIIQEEKLVKPCEESDEVIVEEIKEAEKIEQPPVESPVVTNEIETVELPEPPAVEEEPVKMEVEDEDTSSSMYYKITVTDGKQVLTKFIDSEEREEKVVEESRISEEKAIEESAISKNVEESEISKVFEESAVSDETIEKKDTIQKVEDDNKKDSKSKSSNANKSSNSSNSKKSSSSKSTSNSKDKDKKHSSRRSSKSSNSSRDKDKKKDKEKENDKDKPRSNGSTKHTSSSKSSSSSGSSKNKDKKDSKETKEKQAEKDKNTLEKIKPVTLDKIGRIPKKAPEVTEIKKKPSMSIEPKKKAEDRPKTVKIFNSKMRSTGLEEEAKPPPPRSAVKKPPLVLPPITLPTKRPSPPREHLSTPPEKKLKLEIPERIGAIKLIPPKPKPAFLQESDIFMDALTAASSKKEPKRKKRRLSQSKEPEETIPPAQQPTSPPIGIKSYSPANFYQETLDNTNDNEEVKENKTDEPMEENNSSETTKETVSEEKDNTNSEDISEVSEPSTRTNSDGLKGALVYFKKKGPKRSIRWKDDKDLVDVRYFELDETERVNVSRPNFTELAKLDMTHEREALLGRKLNNEDLMEPNTVWRVPYLVEQPDLPVQPGSKSLEKDIQYARSKNTLPALYFNKTLIPDTPGEPIPQIHPMVDPVMIPLEDAESQVCDLRNTPWPEPKGMAPVEQPPTMQPMFQNMPGPFPNFSQMGPQGFPGMQGPRFGPPNIMSNGPPNMMPNNINMMGNPNMNMGPPIDMMNQGPMNPGPMNQGPMNQGPMNQGPMNPNVFGPNGPNMDGFNPIMNENQNYPMPFNQPNMYGPPNNNFNNMERSAGHRGRGAFRRGHNNWNRNAPRGGNSWRGNGDHRGGRICKNVKNHGYCRKIETCPFIHPN